MTFKFMNNSELILTLKLAEATELRDSLNDLIGNHEINRHHHICSYNFYTGTIDKEIVLMLENE